jgi:hypothetical protein
MSSKTVSPSRVPAQPSVPASPVQRLNSLLGFINGEPDVIPAERLVYFLRWSPIRVDTRTLIGIRSGHFDEANLLTALRGVLAGDRRSQALPTLRFGSRREGDGRYYLTVQGEPQDLVIYEVLQILCDPAIATLAQCPAPQPGNWRLKCGKWFIKSGRRRGRTREFCSDKCRQMAFRKHEADERKHARRKGQ